MITPGQMHKWHGNTSGDCQRQSEPPVRVQRMVGWLRRIGHWLSDEESWRVIYTDGQRSRRMKRRVAKDYKQIFGGRLMFDPRKPANAEMSDRKDNP